MSFTTAALLITSLLTVAASIHFFASLRLKNLRTVPRPPQLATETIKLFPAETRAGIQLHQACFNNNAKAAGEALTRWAWVSGELVLANSLGQGVEVPGCPDFRAAIKDLRSHLDSTNKGQWFGDPLWSAFLNQNPEYQNLAFIG